MVSGNELFDDVGEVVFLSQFNAFSDVTDYSLSALYVGLPVMGIIAGLVFREIDGVLYLADVMVVRTS